MAGDRYSDDVHERTEWQLDQIRQCVMLLAVVAALGVVGGMLLVIMAAGG